MDTAVAADPLALFAIDRAGVFTLADARAASALGASRALLGRSMYEISFTLPHLVEDLRWALAGNTVTTAATLEANASHVRLAPMRDPFGHVLGVVGLVVAGTPEQPRQPDPDPDLYGALLRAQSDLGEMVLVGEKGRVFYVNDAFLDISGYAGGGLSSSTSLFDLVVPEERDLLAERIRASVSGAARGRFETAIRRRDGERIELEMALKPIGAQDGDIPVDVREATIVAIARDITERKRAERALEHQALHDALTGLPNRTLLRDRLEQAIVGARRERGSLALLLLDLDDFKEINDTFGHQPGDELLREIGPRLRDRLGARDREHLRESDTLARLGGDEFAVLLPGADAEGATRVAHEIIAALSRPFEVDGHAVDVGASVGIAVFPRHAMDADGLLRKADIAMYVAKRSRSSFALYSDEHDGGVNRLQYLSELRRGIEAGQLVLHYQPQLDVRTGRVTSMEALVRWRHPERGLIPPMEFIPLAEQSGLVKQLTAWVLDAALRQCRAWHDEGLPVAIAVNLSARNLLDPALPDLVRDLLERWRVSPQWLRLEITESAIMADPERSLGTLLALRGLGVALSIDDFGTGYSSLAYLHRLPVEEVKIDGSFVKAMASQQSGATIVRATVDLGHSLGFAVVAEGVEDDHTRELLARLGCDRAQGFHFGRPMPAEDVSGWLAASHLAIQTPRG